MQPNLTPIQIVREQVSQQLELHVPTEIIAVTEALGRVVADTLLAPENLPHTDNVAVDGYAVQLAALEANPQGWFPIVATIRAGHPFDGDIQPGEAAAVYTGGVRPDGVDCVFMHEDCRVEKGHVQIQITGRKGLNIRPAGENLRQGEICVNAGDKLTPQDIGQLAAAGFETISVKKRLSVHVLSTGDEVANPDQPAAGQTQIADANGPMLHALLAADGHKADYGGIIPDDRSALSQAFQDGLAHADILITSGGASDGQEDHTQAAMADNDIECLFWRIAMKPGRPMAIGQKNGKLVICLPGNPVAVYVCYRLLVSGWLDQLLGCQKTPMLTVPVRAGFAHKKRNDRAEYLRVRLETGADGTVQMQLNGRKGAGVISSLQEADGLVEIPMTISQVEIGDSLAFLPFRESGL